MQIKAGAPRILAAGLETDIAALIDAWWAQELGSAAVMPRPNWSIDHRFHCGGYARCPAYLREFILGWEAEHGAQLDPVYTGKLFYALAQMHEAGEFSPGTRIVALHTGGGQGRRGFNF
jgi:1-aminocyclopropane-1-carboxylate deaminase/D-cysteine desulfhydrase-like pyridoxal-dependent ACC family enzyme